MAKANETLHKIRLYAEHTAKASQIVYFDDDADYESRLNRNDYNIHEGTETELLAEALAVMQVYSNVRQAGMPAGIMYRLHCAVCIANYFECECEADIEIRLAELYND